MPTTNDILRKFVETLTDEQKQTLIRYTDMITEAGKKEK